MDRIWLGRSFDLKRWLCPEAGFGRCCHRTPGFGGNNDVIWEQGHLAKRGGHTFPGAKG
jgi:hypothetical protein